MSSLIAVGCQLHETHQTDVFTRSKRLDGLSELFEDLFVDRLVEDLDLCWELAVSVVVLGKQYTSEQTADVEYVLKAYMSTFNIIVLQEDEFLQRYDTLIEQLEISNGICKDRILRMDHWMYQSCSENVHTMFDHLQRCAQRREIDPSITESLTRVDFSALLKLRHNKSYYTEKLSSWDFAANDFTTAELIYSSFWLIKNLAKDASCHVTDNQLYLLLLSIEASYHQINKFHNFKHAVDVMQATWQLCERILPPEFKTHKLLLCLAAIGHDVAHPGATNALLVDYNSKIATKFGNHSVLEYFHQHLFQELLYNQWPELTELIKKCELHDEFNTIEDSILSTDMAVHSAYVSKLDHIDNNEQLEILLAYIIKAADISNVTRPLRVSAQWALLITFEFENCSLLDKYKKTSRLDPHKTDSETNTDDDLKLTPTEIIKRYPSIPGGQVFFITNFAEEFFNKLGLMFPVLEFLSENIESNKAFWLKQQKQHH